MGFYQKLYVLDPSAYDEMLLRVWEHDPYATEGKDRKYIQLSTTSSVTLDRVRGEAYTVNGIRRPTAEEIEAAAKHAPKPAAAPEPEPCRAITVWQPPVTVAPARLGDRPKPLVISLWHESMVA